MTETLRTHGKGRKLSARDIVVAWLGAFAGIALLGTPISAFPGMQLLVIGSFGASAVLLYASPGAPLAQPRNLIGGHLISALAGAACFKYLPGILVLSNNLYRPGSYPERWD